VSEPAPAAEDLERHRSRIRAYVLRMCRDPAAADDLTQETLLRAHRSLASLREDTALTAWLYRIATRVCYDRFRQVSRLPPHEALDDVPEASDRLAPRLDELLERAEMSACVQEFIAKLPDSYRSAILPPLPCASDGPRRPPARSRPRRPPPPAPSACGTPGTARSSP
jgi:RNA polymerase sigma factor (sigma-70 family)